MESYKCRYRTFGFARAPARRSTSNMCANASAQSDLTAIRSKSSKLLPTLLLCTSTTTYRSCRPLALSPFPLMYT